MTARMLSYAGLSLLICFTVFVAAPVEGESVYQFGPLPRFHPWLLVLDSTGTVLVDRVYDVQGTWFSHVLPSEDGEYLLVRWQWEDSSRVVGMVVNRKGDFLRDLRIDRKGQCLSAHRIGSGFLFSGRSKSGAVWTIATNLNGDRLWESASADTFDHYLAAALPSANGVVTVNYRSEYEPRIIGHVYIEFLDPSGARREHPIMDVPGLCGDMRCPGTFTADGGLFIATGSEQRLWLARTDSLGHVLWRRDSVDYGVSQVSSLISLRNGDFVLAGMLNQDSRRVPKLLRLAPDGALLWQREFSRENTEDSFQRISMAADGTFIVTGESRRRNSRERMALLAELSGGGELLRRTVFEAPVASHFQAARPEIDGSLVLIGGWAADTISVKEQVDAIRARSSGRR